MAEIAQVLARYTTMGNRLQFAGDVHPKASAKQAAKEPQVSVANPEKGALYTLIKTDPDAPSRAEPLFREFIHQVVVNIQSDGEETLVLTGKGETALDYVGCGAPCNSGYHRYIWLLFKQTGKVSVGDTQKFFEGRGGKKAAAFAADTGLEGPLAASWYEGTWDASVDQLHAALGFMPPPKYQSPSQKAAAVAATAAPSAKRLPPIAEKREHEVVFGAVKGQNRGLKPFAQQRKISDPWFWLRDDDRKSEEVLAHLRAENDYGQQELSSLDGLRKTLYDEHLSHLKETDDQIPYRQGDFFYYTRTVKGKSYKIHCRKRVTAAARHKPGPDALEE